MAAPRTFAIRTFGCQMNEHDSERLAGLMVSEGLVAASDERDADVVIFNTCTIRENADLKARHGGRRWRKLKGVGSARLANGSIRRAEFHWYESHGVGRRKMKIKQLLD